MVPVQPEAVSTEDGPVRCAFLTLFGPSTVQRYWLTAGPFPLGQASCALRLASALVDAQPETEAATESVGQAAGQGATVSVPKGTSDVLHTVPLANVRATRACGEYPPGGKSNVAEADGPLTGWGGRTGRLPPGIQVIEAVAPAAIGGVKFAVSVTARLPLTSQLPGGDIIPEICGQATVLQFGWISMQAGGHSGELKQA